jgi:hypothetical protein
MTSTESIAVYNTMAAAFPGASVSLVVSVDDNNSVTTTGIRTNQGTIRAANRGGLKDNIDVGVWVLKSAFTGYAIEALPGRTAAVTYKAQDPVTMRITGTREHACGGLVHLQFGEYDRVTG